MRKLFFLSVLFVSVSSFGQFPAISDCNDSPYLRVLEPIQITSLATDAMLDGFTNSNGFCGYRFMLDSNKTFKKIGFCCIGRSVIDSGYWSVDKNFQIVLKSKRGTLVYYIFKIENWLFFIQETQKEKFIADVKLASKRFSNRKPITIDSKTYSINYIIGASLIQKYYVREADDDTGI